jgi:small subunit ribosomal protein S20
MSVLLGIHRPRQRTSATLESKVDTLELEVVLANTKSAKKRIRQNEKRGVRNKAVLSRTRTYIKQAFQTIESAEFDAADEAVKTAVREIDRAVSKGVLHPNNGARRKSRLVARLNTLKQKSSEA